MAAYFGYVEYASHTAAQTRASVLVLDPKINDLYFLNVQQLNNSSELKNKYQLAKVVRVTGNNVVFVHGRIYYQWQHAVVNSIEHGDLSNEDYFADKLYTIPINKLQTMRNNGTIYLIERPIQGRLYGNFVRRY